MGKKKIILIGGGGHCKSCIEVVHSTGQYEIAGIIDKKEKVGQKVLGYDIIGSDDDLLELRKEYSHALITIGQIKSPRLRESVFKKLKSLDYNLDPIIASTAYVSPSASIGEGTIVMHQVMVNTKTTIGDNCILNTKALIEHDVEVASHCHISTASVINGDCKIGEGCFIGSNATLSNNIQVCKETIISMGAIVRKNIETKGVYTGNPAKQI
jgi:sugar O-acyltransferase (sialic acid O-acetyltransferase NeuD family)